MSGLLNAQYITDNAFTHLWLSAAAYCGARTIVQSHRFSQGPTAGFVATAVIDGLLDVQGFVGYLPADDSIYVVFRGTDNAENFLLNMHTSKAPYRMEGCGCSGESAGEGGVWGALDVTPDDTGGCEVHAGWLAAAQSVFPSVLRALEALVEIHPLAPVKLTGHSLGAVMALLTAVQLQVGTRPRLMRSTVTAITFGSPRIGNAAFARCASAVVPHARFTHLQDPVVHFPLDWWGYVHTCQEVYDTTPSETGGAGCTAIEVRACSVRHCARGLDDPRCAAQWDLVETSAPDHGVYLGMPVTCSAVK